ncbi:MAG: DUF3748 domain-containing protein [Chthonomonadales bacterium]
MTTERQLTIGPVDHDLDNNINFSPDSRFVVFDCRKDNSILDNRSLGVVEISTGKIEYFYKMGPEWSGVGAVSFLNNSEVIAMHALQPDFKYDFTERAGRIISLKDKSGRWLDSRNIHGPFTAGALRGGTHKHEPDHSNAWVGFTYNDHIMKTQNGTDLRNVGVSQRGTHVIVDQLPGNVSGESFSVLLTACVDHPKPGTDEFSRSDGDCWVGQHGYRTRSGQYQRARAFRGTVARQSGNNQSNMMDVYVVDVPDDITIPGPLGPLQGTATTYPAPPKGATVRRLTRFANTATFNRITSVSHLRASGNGHWIAFIVNPDDAVNPGKSILCLSPETGELKELVSHTNNIPGTLRFSQDNKFVVFADDKGIVYSVSASDRSWSNVLPISPAGPPVTNIDIAPDCRSVVYNRVISGVKQIFVTHV